MQMKGQLVNLGFLLLKGIGTHVLQGLVILMSVLISCLGCKVIKAGAAGMPHWKCSYGHSSLKTRVTVLQPGVHASQRDVAYLSQCGLSGLRSWHLTG